MKYVLMRGLGIWAILSAAFLAIIGMVDPLFGQVATDTVWVTVEGRLSFATILVNDTTLRIGDTIQFVAVAGDEDGDPVTVQFTWASSNPSVITIDPVTGLAITVGKSSEPVAISVMAEEIGEIHVASYVNGELSWGTGSVEVGHSIHFCAYLVSPDQYLLAEDPGPPTCPIVFLPRLVSDSRFASVLRVRKLIIT